MLALRFDDHTVQHTVADLWHCSAVW